MQPSSAVLLTALLLLSGGDAFLFERAASSRSRLTSAPPTTVRTRGAAADDDGFQLGPASVEASDQSDVAFCRSTGGAAYRRCTSRIRKETRPSLPRH